MLENPSCTHHLRVDSVTIDALCDQLNVKVVDVIKMDAEGAEPLILSGASALFAKGQPKFILMEFSPLNWQGFSYLLPRLSREFVVFEIRRYPASIRQLALSDLPNDRQTMLLLARKEHGDAQTEHLAS
jgi:hypothetical protein